LSCEGKTEGGNKGVRRFTCQNPEFSDSAETVDDSSYHDLFSLHNQIFFVLYPRLAELKKPWDKLPNSALKGQVMTKTMILGKDAALEDSIERMKGLLLNLGFEVEEASWLNPVPHVWSVHIRDKFCPFLFTNGKGASKLAALASALGEFFERLNCNYFFADYYLGEKIAQGEFVHYPQEKWFPIEGDEIPSGLLDKTTMAFYNPQKALKASHLVDTNSGNKKRGICALPFVKQRDQKTVWIPMNIVGNLYVSNGMSAGNSPTEARVQALSEVFERSIKNKIISEKITLPDVPQTVIDKFPRIAAAIKELEACGYPILVKDASLGGKYPVMNVTLFNPKEGTCFASFGAHPKFEVALERTLTELLQGRSLDKLDVFSPPTFDDEAVQDHLNLEAHFIDSNGFISWDFFKAKSPYNFVEWNFKGENTTEEFNTLLNIFHEINKEVYIADYHHLGVYGCRILVPSMSEIYQPEDLVWDNNNSMYDLRSMILNFKTLTKENCATLAQELDERGFDDMLLVTHALGIISDPDTTWATLRMGELKAMLHLKAGDKANAKNNTDWLLHFAPLAPHRRLLYLCLDNLLDIEENELEPQDYELMFVKLYGTEMLDRCRKLINAETCFDGLLETNLNLDGFQMHQKLLQSYEKLQKAKKAWMQKSQG
jgi:ribosomal protein S12 methylthiotransferase accessory factor